MAQFDVYLRRGGPGFILDCQAGSLAGMGTRFVVPLLPRLAVPSLIALLNPVFNFRGEHVVLMPQSAATLTLRELGQVLASMEPHRHVIMNALDMLLTGY